MPQFDSVLALQILDLSERSCTKRYEDNLLFFPGFPTLKHLKYKGEVGNIRVKVFDQPSRNESMIIRILDGAIGDKTTEKLAKEFIGRTM